jgi:ketosteroid isomerase-like protein
MCNQNEWIVREAFLAYDKGDIARMLEFVDPDLEWTGRAGADSRALHGRLELEKALRQQAEYGLRGQLEQVIAAGEKVILVMRTPGLDQHRDKAGDDRTYDVATIRDGLIVTLHACRDRGEARSLAGIA